MHMKELIKMKQIMQLMPAKLAIFKLDLLLLLYYLIKHYINANLGFPCQQNINCD